ncbi:MAG: DNA-binding response regulator [Burkholderia sp.]|nr:DNA-binding response regulator [Burkholderia sp.]
MKIACYIRTDTVLAQIRGVVARAGFECDHFSTETTLMRALRREPFDLLLVDFAVEAPADDNILSWLNCRSGDTTPVLGISPVRNADFVALVLNSGADDCITRPFEAAELIARLHAVLRRSGRRIVRRSIQLGRFSLDREASRFTYQDVPIALTPREFSMAWLLFSSPGTYVSRETIGTAIWGIDSEIAGRTIEQHVYKLRKKLQLGPERGVLIRTAYSRGYRLELCDSEPI